MTSYLDLEGQRKRRDLWFQTTREHVYEVLNPDGTPKMPQFDAPYREPLWMAPALYTGSQEHIDLINRVIARWHDTPRLPSTPGARETHGSDFGIFQSNMMTHLYHRFHDRITPEVEKVMRIHLEHATRTFFGSGQPDTKFQGVNDNMPMMATQGLIFAGEALGNKDAVRQGLWNLNQFRLLLSRAAWASEFNSSTYTSVTLSMAAQIATYASDPEIRELALTIEHRLWAEALLHFHPSTFRQAGPQSRAYAIDYAGHSHDLQLVLWMVFGPEISGRDMIRSYFKPDGIEVIHFEGCYFQSIAEFCHLVDTDYHVPADLAELAAKRNYPARLRGRTEANGAFDAGCVANRTETYMEEEFSLGTSNIPMWGGEQTPTLYATYKLKPVTKDFRDAASVFYKYATARHDTGSMVTSFDKGFQGEKFFYSQGWPVALQKDNTALLLTTPNLSNAPVETDTLKLDVIFPAHYGQITRSIMGGGPVVQGVGGESGEVIPVSVEAGEVFIHINPLIPTNLPRGAAVRFQPKKNHYEVLELVNYEGPKRKFSREELGMVLNGFVLSIEAKSKYQSLEEFHQLKSAALVIDYLFAGMRFVEFKRKDVWFNVLYTPSTGGVQTEAVDGRSVPRPMIESNQIDVTKLPFVTGPVEPNFPLFPWKDSLDVCWYPDQKWMIGSRGLPEERSYSKRKEKIQPKQ